MRTITSRVAFVGAGSMGGSIAAGIVGAGLVDASLVSACDPSQDCRDRLAALGIATFSDAREMLAQGFDVAVLAVKPQILPAVVADVAGELGGHAVISIAAGTPLATLDGLLPASRLIRVMPNLPVQLLSGATAVCAGPRSTAEDLELARALFAALGVATVMREDQLDAEGAVVSCGPAYIALMADLMTRAGVEHGLAAQDCREMVLSTMRGVAAQLLESGEHPRAYMERVTSPGGTTAAALRAMEPAMTEAVLAAVDAALVRTRELAEG